MDEGNMPPDDYYRLYLLEGALQQLIHTLDVAKQERRQEETGCSSQAREVQDLSEVGLVVHTANPAGDSLGSSAEDQTKSFIVGDADIFS
jgi:hypothetical protein